MGDPEHAVRDFNQTLQLNPGEAAAYLNRGNAYGKLGERSLAYKDWRQACEGGVQDTCDWLSKHPE